MSNLNRLYDLILSNTKDFDPDLIYFSIGCALGYYNDIDPNTHQQYPKPIMEKYYDKKKLIILMDRTLEKPLKIQELDKNISLIEETDLYRILISEDKLIFAINSYYYFELSQYDESKYQFNMDYSFLISLLGYTIENKKKMIVQNFSGANIENSYIKFLDIFPKEELFKHIIFDVSNSDGNCGFNFAQFPIRYDQHNNFINVKFNNLVRLKNLDATYFKRFCNEIINKINYQLLRKLRMIRGELEPSNFEDKELQIFIGKLKVIYPDIYDSSLTEGNIINIITILLQDICESLQIPRKLIQDLSNNGFKQNEVINCLTPLKNLY
jgi:hypothetical protein